MSARRPPHASSEPALGDIPPNLRGVEFALPGDRLHLPFHFDGAITVEDRESASCVKTELIASLPPEARVSMDIRHSDPPGRMADLDRWVYHRRE